MITYNQLIEKLDANQVQQRRQYITDRIEKLKKVGKWKVNLEQTKKFVEQWALGDMSKRVREIER